MAAAVEDIRRRNAVGVSEVVNDLLRQGLTQRQQGRVFRQRSSDMGLPQLPIDDVAGLLDAVEGDDRRS